MNVVTTRSEQFAETGFLIFDHPVISDALLKGAQAGIRAIRQGAYDTGIAPVNFATSSDQHTLQRISKVHVANFAIRQLISESGVGKLASEILRAKQIKLWGSQLYYKPPGKGITGNVGWHRDSQHIDCFEGDIIIAWIALDTILEQSGCLKYITASHRQDSFPTPAGGAFQNIEQESHRLTTENPNYQWEEVNVLLPAGGVSFHHWDLIHGSGPNLTNKPRIGLSLGLASDNLRIKENTWDFGFKAIINDSFYCPIIYG
ncbi:hypothetical protein BKI52_39975 [marine bacterium AO1-C]|nr:hypothetical protein BKI52_39975 [marine bacterium AO1-C]